MLYVNSICCTFIKLAFTLTLLGGEFTFASLKPAVPQGQSSSSASLPHSHSSQIKSYREWKQSMVADAEGRLKTLKDTLLRSKGLSLSATEAGVSANLQRMLDKEELQFALAQDLTISDYFVGYLTKQKSLSQAIKEVSGKLSAEEVAELMTAYADGFFSSKPSGLISFPRADSEL